MRDVDRGTTIRVSVGESGQQGTGDVGRGVTAEFGDIAIAGDGRSVAFSSTAQNLVAGDANFSDVFVRVLAPMVPEEQTFGAGGHSMNTTVYESDPVNTATGSLLHSEMDFSLPAPGVPFVFSRVYNSGDESDSVLGVGWQHSLGAALDVAWDGDVVLRGEDGQQTIFELLGDGSYRDRAGGRSRLASVAGGFELVRMDQVRYRFDSAGRLIRWVDRSDQGLTISYSAGLIDTVTDAAGRAISFAHDANGRLTEISLPDGRSVSFAYSAGRLASVTDLRGGTMTYTYSSAGLLAEIINQEAERIIANVYDGDGRVVEQTDALGKVSTFAWDPGTQTSTFTDADGRVWVDEYNENVLVRRVDPLGNEIVVDHDEDLNPIVVSDPLASEWTLEFDAAGNLLSRTMPAPLSLEESWTYDAANNPLSHTDVRGITWLFDYDASGRLTKRTRPGGTFETFTYTTAGLVATHTDYRGNTTNYSYDADGNLVAVESPSGATTTYGYDIAGRITSMVEPRGNEPGAIPADYTTSYSYDAAGHLLGETDPLGNTTTHTYDAAGRLATTVDAAGRTTSYAYNDAGELTSVTRPGGRTTSYSYDDRGLLVAETEPEGRTTTYTYDQARRLASKVTPRGNVAGADPDDYRWTYSYDAAGRVETITDPLGGTTSNDYDAAGRLVSVTDPRGKTTSYTYDGNNNQTSITDPTAATTTSSYDALNRLISVTDPRGKTTSYTYDANDNQTSITSPLGYTQTHTYDADNRPVGMVEARGNQPGATPSDYEWITGYDSAGNRISHTDPLGNQTLSSYDRAGRLTGEIDPLGHMTGYSYDPLGRITAVTSHDATTTSYVYDTAGDLIRRTDQLGRHTDSTYDAAGRRTSIVSPIGQTWTYSYDAADNLTTTIDAAGNATPTPGDGTTIRSYDALDRLIGIDYSDATPDVTYTYDAAGNRLTMSDTAGIETRSYDDANRLTGITRGTSIIAYQYDPAGNTTRRTYPDLSQIDYGYDDDNRLATITGPGTASSYTYDAANNPISLTHTNGTVETRMWDRAGRPSEVRHKKGTTTFAVAGYVRDAAGNPTQLTTLDGTVIYSYDTRSRLIQACWTPTCSGIAPDGGDSFATYTYDAAGNRLAMTGPLGTTNYTYNAADQLTSQTNPTGTQTYGYDPNGNQITSGSRTNSYDQAGRLTSSSQLGTTLTYSYDGDGKRLAATTNSIPAQTTRYTWDPTFPLPETILETTAAGSLIRRHVHGHNPLTTTSPDPINPATHRTVTLHPDTLGSITAITDSAAATDWRYTYQPYGSLRREHKDDILAAENRIQYTGQHTDLETGYLHLRARQYDPTLGRFLTPDPQDRQTGEPWVNTYSYTDAQPTLLTDPSGLRGSSPRRGFVPAPAPPVPALPKTAPKGGPVIGLLLLLGQVIEHQEDIETAAADVYDWFSRNDQWDRKLIYRGLFETKKGQPDIHRRTFRYDADGVSFFEVLRSTHHSWKLGAAILQPNPDSTRAVFEDPLLTTCVAAWTPSPSSRDHWSVRCAGGKEGTQNVLARYAAERRHMISPHRGG